jgi:hypothetical protein
LCHFHLVKNSNTSSVMFLPLPPKNTHFDEKLYFDSLEFCLTQFQIPNSLFNIMHDSLLSHKWVSILLSSFFSAIQFFFSLLFFFLKFWEYASSPLWSRKVWTCFSITSLFYISFLILFFFGMLLFVQVHKPNNEHTTATKVSNSDPFSFLDSIFIFIFRFHIYSIFVPSIYGNIASWCTHTVLFHEFWSFFFWLWISWLIKCKFNLGFLPLIKVCISY